MSMTLTIMVPIEKSVVGWKLKGQTDRQTDKSQAKCLLDDEDADEDEEAVVVLQCKESTTDE